MSRIFLVDSDRHKPRMTGSNADLPDMMLGTGKIFISGTAVVFSIRNCIFLSQLGVWNTEYRPLVIQINEITSRKLANTEYSHIVSLPIMLYPKFTRWGPFHKAHKNILVCYHLIIWKVKRVCDLYFIFYHLYSQIKSLELDFFTCHKTKVFII